MDRPHATLTDLDDHLVIRVAGDTITIELAATALRLPPGELARRIVETAAALPAPGQEARAALEAGIDDIADLQRTLATAGYEAFAAQARRRLGLDTTEQVPADSPETDRDLGTGLAAAVDDMRARLDRTPPQPPEPLHATAATDEGDIAVTTSTDRRIAAVELTGDARRRGLDGLAATLTDLLARAHDDLRAIAGQRLRDELPDDLAHALDDAPAQASRNAAAARGLIDQTLQSLDAVKRKADHT